MLDHIGNIKKVDEIKIKKAVPTLMSKKGYEDSYSWSGGPGHFHYTAYFAVWYDGAGEEHYIQLENAGRSGNGDSHIGEHEWDAPTVGEQLFDFGIDPTYIVECIKNDHDDNGRGDVTRYWTIYKMKDFNLVNYHHERIDQAAAALKAEITAACQ